MLVANFVHHPNRHLLHVWLENLDHENALKLTELLLELNKEQGTALIVVTHSMELAEKMDKIYELRSGQLLAI